MKPGRWVGGSVIGGLNEIRIILGLQVYEWLFTISSQLKRQKRPCIGRYDKLQNFFQLMVTVIKEKLNL